MKGKVVLKNASVLLIAVIMVLSTIMIVAGNASTETLTWNIETVDSTGTVGQDTSIALDTSNNPHISYFDHTNANLKYAYIGYDGSWRIETVDSTGTVGQDTSIALDTSNNPHISYSDDTNGDLKYATADVNNPPNKPDKPSGETNGKAGDPYPYTTNTTDLDGDVVKYGWDLDGDGSVDKWDDNNGGYYPSGVQISTSLTWSSQGTYNLKVIAEDINGAQSAWSDPLSVSMPKNRAINRPFLKFFENHPDLFPILQRLLKLLGL